MAALDRSAWPAPLGAYVQVVGVFVGGCVARGEGSRFRAKAHAHTRAWDQNHGWLCVLSPARLTDQALVLHELAHLIAGPVGHTDRWRRALLALGGTLDRTGSTKDYHKRQRTGRHHPECPCRAPVIA